jgi:hypothetical protein
MLLFSLWVILIMVMFFFPIGDPHHDCDFLFVSIQTFVLNPYISLFCYYVIILPYHVGCSHGPASYFLLCILNPSTLPPLIY